MTQACSQTHPIADHILSADGKERQVSFYKHTYIICPGCSHQNRWHKKALNNIMLILTGIDFACQRCGHQISTEGLALRKTPLRLEAYNLLLSKGWTPKVTLF